MKYLWPLVYLALVLGCNESAKVSTNNVNTNVNATPTPELTFADLKKHSDTLLAIPQATYEDADINEFDPVLRGLQAIPKESKDFKESQALFKKVSEKVAEIAAERIVLGPKPKNSEWDGSVLPVKEYLQAVLNDYNSSEFVEWSPVVKTYIKKEPFWAVRLRLRAKNGFGALILRETYYYIRNNKVVKSEGLS